ncbi:MAG: leucine--tRNA ligase [Candidatus Moranbacteria bacterium CG_4_10_14_3_um_filter_45_9]|nr:MAG: leucine--tRNA ligase [Candidatus Moranbacteria bacterium CG2_30_45_14]PIX89991.1 MAG: leucine--tRNA ligase [Candidatus Moranbacteria bacterium CG_4_10_14_3_um_filter_45_9]
MKKLYNPKTIEKKWQKVWMKQGVSKKALNKGKLYILDMFPYPSGDGLHVGHVENFTATDIYARFKRFLGYDVLRPMGWDAFGLPAENFAIKTGIHPKLKTLESIKNFKRQMKSVGLLYDWDREINTSSPEYYKWTQWMFLFLYTNGLAYKKKAKVNWCEACHTVLANEQVIDGKCDRSGDIVIQKDLEQWFFKITDFVEPTKREDGTKISGLLSGLEKIDWPESTKAAQRHWIGRSEGAEVVFYITDTEEEVRVFTTRLDTIYGCTYIVIAPEHPLVRTLESRMKNAQAVKKYIAVTKKKTDLERTELNKEKTGICLQGVEVVHPFTGERLPVYVADYVLGTYGTGAVMGVPAHDERDFIFAKKYQLEILEVIQGKEANHKEKPYTEDGTLIASKEFTGLHSEEAREKMLVWLQKEKLGRKVVNYRLRDWLISRQRYWGAPIPIIYCDDCGVVPVPEKDLPVKLPADVDFRPTGESPLVRSKSFHNVKCPKCGKKARRESDTMDTFVCSSWYYMRFADPHNIKTFASKKALATYLPVDFYIGGSEHTVLHLLYARFFTKALMKYGYLEFDEPFQKLRHQGMILAQDGQKMSKSKGNVVNPDQMVAEFGADSLRLYEMFMGPFEDMKAWNTGSIIGVRRFLEKVWRLGQRADNKQQKTKNVSLESLLHRTIKKVTEDLEELKFNTAISSLMILMNEMEKSDHISRITYQTSLVLLSPLAPHITEELWSQLGEKKSIFFAQWPKWDTKKIAEESSIIVVQINGKVRATFQMATGSSEAEVKKVALADANVQAYTEGKAIRKIIYIKDKILSLVIGD